MRACFDQLYVMVYVSLAIHGWSTCCPFTMVTMASELWVCCFQCTMVYRCLYHIHLLCVAVYRSKWQTMVNGKQWYI